MHEEELLKKITLLEANVEYYKGMVKLEHTNIKLTKLGKELKKYPKQVLYCYDELAKKQCRVLISSLSEKGIYRLYKDNNIVYIGKSKNLLKRIRVHTGFDEFDFVTLNSSADLDIYEIYYINKYKPELNKDCNSNDELSVELKELTFSERFNKYDLSPKRMTVESRRINKILNKEERNE